MKILSEKAIADYQALCKDEGWIISKDEAQREGLKLLRFVQLIYKPIPKNNASNGEMKKYAKHS